MFCLCPSKDEQKSHVGYKGQTETVILLWSNQMRFFTLENMGNRKCLINDLLTKWLTMTMIWC